MKSLFVLSKAYSTLIQARDSAAIAFDETNDSADISAEIKTLLWEAYKNLGKQADEQIESFIAHSKAYSQKNNIPVKELIIQLAKPHIMGEQPAIHPFLLIHLMWKREKEKNNFCLETLEALLRTLLTPPIKSQQEVYYIECLIDIWHYDSDSLIPIDILEAILMMEQTGAHNYDAFIKASSYLKAHPEELVEGVVARVRHVRHYLEDEYYQMWI